MATRHYWPIRYRSAVTHRMRLEKLYPAAKVHARDRVLNWSGTLQPTPLSPAYKVELKYSPGARPVVHVLEPKLVCREGERLPHVYPGEELCLYYPGDWDGEEQLAETIIPWISEWLLHYEVWLATGVWCGGGVHPEVKDEEKLLKSRKPPRLTSPEKHLEN